MFPNSEALLHNFDVKKKKDKNYMQSIILAMLTTLMFNIHE